MCGELLILVVWGSAGMPHYTSPVLHSGAWACTSPELIFQQLRDEVLWSWRDLGSDTESFAAQRGAGEPSQVGALWAGQDHVLTPQLGVSSCPAMEGFLLSV